MRRDRPGPVPGPFAVGVGVPSAWRAGPLGRPEHGSGIKGPGGPSRRPGQDFIGEE